MRPITQDESTTIFKEHLKWLMCKEDGKRADLRYANLSNVDLRYANLSNADLRYTNLTYINLSNADLRYTNLSSTDLRYANLSNIDLRYADMSNADLRYANLSNVDLRYANLSNADLSNADLRYADLSNADLSNADLSSTNLTHADLRNANLHYTNLRHANLSFSSFPPICTLMEIQYAEFSDEITLELMRRDAYAHPNPELFCEWVTTNKCPYHHMERLWKFKEKKELWQPGNPTMRDSDLVLAICREMGWGIKGYLEPVKEEDKP